MGRALIVIVTQAFGPIIEEAIYDIEGLFPSYHMWSRASIRSNHLGFLLGSSCVFCDYGDPDVSRHVAGLNFHVPRIASRGRRD